MYVRVCVLNSTNCMDNVQRYVGKFKERRKWKKFIKHLLRFKLSITARRVLPDVMTSEICVNSEIICVRMSGTDFNDIPPPN